MIRKINRVVQDFLRPIRINIGKKIWDKKVKNHLDLITNGKIDMKKVKSIIFLRYDGKIGDMVISSLMFREVKKAYPNIKIGVVSRGGATDIIKYNPYIDCRYIYEKGNEKKIASEIARENYDILVDFSTMLRVNQMKFINLCRAKINIGLNKEGWNLFDLSYKMEEAKHITKTYKKILELLDIENLNLDYDIFIGDEIKEKVENIIKERIGKTDKNSKIIVLNPYAASKHRSFTKEKIIEIGKKILEKKENLLIIIGEPSKSKEIDEIIELLGKERVFNLNLNNILEVTELISRSDYVITPDTSIVHIGVSQNIPMTAVYRLDKDDDINSKLWGPNSNRVKQIYSSDRAIKPGDETDINKFNIEEI